MPTIKEYNNKLKSLKNTKKITKTMKMVSASKLRRAQEAQANAKLYAQNLQGMISRIAASVEKTSHPLLKDKVPAQNALILVITSDKGLCGAFNNNANKAVLAWVRENKAKYKKIDLAFCGKRGYMFFRKHFTVKNYYENMIEKPNFNQAIKIGTDLAQWFMNNEYDEVYLDYNQFLSPLSQKTIFEKILPIDAKVLIKEEKMTPGSYEFEPDYDELLSFILPHYLYFKIYFALLENSAGEHGARMTAMENATKNASELIDRNTLLRNRARQAAITTELTEIVAGAEAIK
jgi:F-type H+-transporting ATPase subunit gamma